MIAIQVAVGNAVSVRSRAWHKDWVWSSSWTKDWVWALSWTGSIRSLK
jgi:hypothetical protein